MDFKVGDYYTYTFTGSVYKILDFNNKYIQLLYIPKNKDCGNYRLSVFLTKKYFHKSTEDEISKAIAERLKS